jgi:hypothetical protein
MMLRSCPREKEVRELVALGHWPQACAPELRAHVNQCRSCGDLALVAEAFQQARVQAAGSATLIAPGVLWWRAQLRRRNQALERIGKPLLGAQVFALAFTLLLAVGFVVWQVRQGLGWLSWLWQFPPAHMPNLAGLWSSGLFSSAWSWVVLIPILATVALLGGVVVYLAAEKQ